MGRSSARTRSTGLSLRNRDLIAGLGAALAADGASWSPELGIKFLHAEDVDSSEAIDISLRLLVLPILAPTSGGFRGVAILLGWNIF